jgi:hypothetical protein
MSCSAARTICVQSILSKERCAASVWTLPSATHLDAVGGAHGPTAIGKRGLQLSRQCIRPRPLLRHQGQTRSVPSCTMTKECTLHSAPRWHLMNICCIHEQSHTPAG